MKRAVFFLSDGTGITVEAIAHSLLAQFQGMEFDRMTVPFIHSTNKAWEVVQTINDRADRDGVRPLLFSTLVDPEVRRMMRQSKGFLIDLFDAFISPLEAELGATSSHAVGKTHGVSNHTAYKERIDATNYAVNNDDGVSGKQYGEADLIVIGVSRCGKTPVCLYLALNYGLKAANYPITEDDLDDKDLPALLKAHQKKLFGLSIDPQRLHQIRNERRPGSRYASLAQCEMETLATRQLFERYGIPSLDTTNISVEEIVTAIVHRTGLRNRLYG